MTTDTRNEKGWPNVFAGGRGTGSAMASIYVDAGGGRNLRGLYADFVDEAAELLSRPALREAAAAWRGAAQAWDAIVDTALPPADELRELIDRTDDAVTRGKDAAEVAAARWALQARRDEAGELPARRARGRDARRRGRRARASQGRRSVMSSQGFRQP